MSGMKGCTQRVQTSPGNWVRETIMVDDEKILKITPDINAEVIESYIQAIRKINMPTLIELEVELKVEREHDEEEIQVRYDAQIEDKIKELFKALDDNQSISKVGVLNGAVYPWIRTLLGIAFQEITPNLLKKFIRRSSDDGLNSFYLRSVFNNSEVVFDRLCSDERFRELLKEIKTDTQILSCSCVAHEIMSFLYDKNSPQFSVLTEMEIYKKIWRTFGEQADPSKIKAYLNSLGYQVDLIIDKSFSEAILKKSPETKALYLYTKGLFESNATSETAITESTFSRGDGALLVVDSGRHAVLVKRLESGSIQLFDANCRLVNEFASVQTLMDAARREESVSVVSQDDKPLPSNFTGVLFKFFKPENKSKSKDDDSQDTLSNKM